MESKCIPKKRILNIKYKYIPRKKKVDKKKDIGIDLKLCPDITRYRKGKYIDAYISENEGNDDGFFW